MKLGEIIKPYVVRTKKEVARLNKLTPELDWKVGDKYYLINGIPRDDPDCTFCVWVDAHDWLRVTEGDNDARVRLGQKLDRIVIYDHVFVPINGEIPVSIDSLLEYGVIDAVRLHYAIPPD